MIHGRFQPFHLGHLEYLRGAAARCEGLLLGITNPDRAAAREEPADPVRHTPAANPFTYVERLAMVQAVLRAEGVHDALVVPFPISEPERWPAYVPAGTVQFLRIFDGWGMEKAARLRAAGYPVVVLDEGIAKAVTGTEVRARLRADGPWRELVPPAVIPILERLREQHARDLPGAS